MAQIATLGIGLECAKHFTRRKIVSVATGPPARCGQTAARGAAKVGIKAAQSLMSFLTGETPATGW